MLRGSFDRGRHIQLLSCIQLTRFKGGRIISDKPGLKIKYFGSTAEDYCDLEQGRGILNFALGIILADGRRVQNYAELVELAALDQYKSKNFIEIVVLRNIAGG
jgi:hypothetical protein